MKQDNNGWSWRGFIRTKESGGRRSRTLKLHDGSGQVQAKEARREIETLKERFFQVRWWAEETDCWTHLVVDPKKKGLDSIVAVGCDHNEKVSWEQARQAAKSARGIEL